MSMILHKNACLIHNIRCTLITHLVFSVRLFTMGPMVLAAMGIMGLYAKESFSKLNNDGKTVYTIQERNRHRRLIVILLGFLFFTPTSVVVFQTFVHRHWWPTQA